MNIKKMFLLLILSILFTMLPSKTYAASYSFYTVKVKCPVRTEASDKSNTLMSGNDVIKVSVNQELDYIETKTGPNNGLNNQTWYKVRFDYAARSYIGYVAKACMNDVKTYSYSDDTSFEQSIKNFPESYKEYLRRLHSIHPNWTFTLDNSYLDFNQAALAQSEKGESAISYLYPSLIFKDTVNPNGIIVDGNSWYAPALDAVKYYMDPRNFLNIKNIFMFQSLVYNEREDSSVQSILNGSFMKGSFTENGVTKTYSNGFIDAAKESGVSSVHLASRALQELGTSIPPQATGTVSGYEGYYNFYNIGAYSGADNYLKGLLYAKNHGWNSIQKALTGGAKEIGSGYILKGQDTLYFQKFNVSSKRARKEYTHQYQTNIMAPYQESASIYSSYSSTNKLNNSYNFVIPVYSNMTSDAFKVSRTDKVGGSTDPTSTTTTTTKETTTTSSSTTKQTNKNESTTTVTTTTNTTTTKKTTKPISLTAEEMIKKSGYSLSNGYITKMSFNMDVNSLKQKLLTYSSNVGVMNSSWNSKVSGKISTGDVLSINNKNYQVVLYGDISGDGNAGIKDLLLVQKHLLNSKKLSGSNKEAADVSHDNNITIKDLLLIQKYLLRTGNIVQ